MDLGFRNRAFLPMVPIRRTLASAPASPILTLMPAFQVELTHGPVIRRVMAGFDSGMVDTHLQIPSGLASELALVRTGSRMLVDSSGRRIVASAVIDRVTVPGMDGCGMENCSVMFFEGAPTMVGSDFMRRVGALVSYGEEKPTLRCEGPGLPIGRSITVFPVTIRHLGRSFNVEALFDTGWETSDLVVSESMAERIGLEILGEESAESSSGTYTASVSMVDEISVPGSPGCRVEDAKVKIRREAPYGGDDLVVVGGPFLEKVKATVGYGPGGPYYRCGLE